MADEQALIPFEMAQELTVSLNDGSSYTWKYSVTRFDAELILAWLHGKARNTIIAYLKDIARYYEFSQKSLRATRYQDILRFDDYLKMYRNAKDEKLSVATRMRILAALKSVLTHGAKKSKMLESNEGAFIDLPKPDDTLAERIMSEEQVEELLDSEHRRRDHAMLTLLYYGGLRVSELCNLTWRNLQERNATGQIAVYGGKGGKTRHVLLDGDTWREVWGLRPEQAGIDEYVFPSRQATTRAGGASRRMSERRVAQIVKRAAKVAGVAINEQFESKVSPHWFRHAHATHSLEAGAPITLVADTLGHGSILVTRRYAHVRPSDSSAFVLRKRQKREE